MPCKFAVSKGTNKHPGDEEKNLNNTNNQKNNNYEKASYIPRSTYVHDGSFRIHFRR